MTMRLPRAVVALLLSLVLAACARLAAAQSVCTGGSGGPAGLSLFVPYSFNLLRAKHGVPPLYWNGGFSGQRDDWVMTKLAASCAVQEAIDGGCKRVEAGVMSSTCRNPKCPDNAPPDCLPAWGCPADADRCPIITWTCQPSDCKGDACTTAVDQWTSYKWVDSDTPLDDNPQGLDYAQIVWAGATQVACMQQATGDCKAVVCIFNKAIELTNEAFKANVKPLVAGASPAADKYSWCKFAKKLDQCKDKHLKCDDGTVADCCQTTCTEFVPPVDPAKPKPLPDEYPWCSLMDISITKELCKFKALEFHRLPISECCRTSCAGA